ncbi:MAG TPA: PVC-type heme-binding CxxCH protein [Bryobacterales bacterium]|nr:PVC-type heme-binding CxxCH protein [Bryobacterales bacterium]
MRPRHNIFLAVVVFLAALLAGCARSKPPFFPEQALQTFRLPAGLHVELAAAEPEVISPVAMTFDERGRLFVVEMPDYPLKPESMGRIRMLEDRDGDGRFEHSTIFAEGLHFPNGVMAWNGGILVTCAPDVIYFKDTNGDGRADVRRVVLTGFAETNPQLRVNAPVYGLDNWIYLAYPRVSIPSRYIKEFGDLGKPLTFPGHPEVKPLEIHGTDVRFRPDKLKVEAAAGNSEFGDTFDQWGGRFTVWNNDHVRYVVLPNGSIDRNPYLPIDSSADSISDHDRAAKVFGITKHLEYIHDSELGRFTSACGISVYTGDRFPREFQGNFFVCEPASNLIHRDVLTPSGPTLSAHRVRQGVEFLASTDGWFRPVFTTVGPDGALYVVDFYRPVIEHPEWIPPEMMKDLDLYAGAKRGRIYRVVPDGSEARPRPKLNEASSSDLVAELSNANLWWRITAQRLLVGRQDKSALPALEALASKGPSPLGRIHALWTLEGLQCLDADLVLAALADPNARIREQGVRLAGEYLQDPKVRSKLFEMVADPDDRVELELASLLGELPNEQGLPALEKIALRHIEDRWFRTAVLASAGDDAGRWFQAMITRKDFAGGATDGRKEFLSELASIIGARQKDSEIAGFLAMAGGSHGPAAVWWQQAAIHGLATGLRRGSKGLVPLPAAQPRVVALLNAPAPELRQAALRVAQRIDLADTPGLRATMHKASEVAQDPVATDKDPKLDDRVLAIGILGLDPTSGAAPLLEKLLSPHEPPEVEAAAANALCTLRDPKVIGFLLDQWKSFAGPVRDSVLAAFFSDRRRVPLLLDAIQAEKVQAWSLKPGQRSRLLRSQDPEIRKRAEVLFANAPSDRKAVLDKYRPSIHMAGDATRGQQIFRETCSECHKIGNYGSEVGPDLLSVITRPKETLLNDILIPSQNIEDGYEEYMVETTDGRMITGVIAAQTASTITLRRAKGEQDTVPRSIIASLRSLNVSPMPEDLEKKISVDRMADLLAYLKSLR